MDIKLTAAVATEGLNVAEFCRDQGIGRTAFYKWRGRYLAEGLPGLVERSRRPHGSAPRLDVGVEDEIVRLRKELADAGLDAGAATIVWHLERAGLAPVPSEATVWRALRRRGQIVDQPAKRPRSSYRRFQYERPNECWQIDATEWTMPSGTVIDIIDLIDDCSRVALGSVAVPSATTKAAWAAFVAAADRWGLPGMVLSDNGLAFSGHRRNRTVAFEANLRALGIRPVCSSPYHPQTCGKVERFHQTLKKWLHEQPPARTLTALNRQLQQFGGYYNTQRPHRALGKATPAEVHASLAHAGPANHPLATPARITTAKVCVDGSVWSQPWRFALGRRLAGQTVTVIVHDDQGLVFDHDQLLLNTTLDPNQPLQRNT